MGSFISIGLLGAAAGKQGGQTGGFGDLLNQAIAGRGTADLAPTVQQEAMAALMLRAIIQAAKSDGKVDAAEEKKLLLHLGDVSADERAFVQAELRATVDVQGLAAQVPQGLEQQVYTMSIMGIDLDNRAEAQYLHQLAQAMGLQPQLVNQLHAHLGVPSIYS